MHRTSKSRGYVHRNKRLRNETHQSIGQLCDRRGVIKLKNYKDDTELNIRQSTVTIYPSRME